MNYLDWLSRKIVEILKVTKQEQLRFTSFKLSVSKVEMTGEIWFNCSKYQQQQNIEALKYLSIAISYHWKVCICTAPEVQTPVH